MLKFACCVLFIVTVAFRQNQNRIYCRGNTDKQTHLVVFYAFTGLRFLNVFAAIISAYATTVRFVNKYFKVETRTLDRMRRSYTGSILDDEFD